MSGPDQIVIFTLDEQRYGIPLEVVERVVRMVEITSLPASPVFIRGIINVQGKIIPVVDLRRRFGLPEHPVELSDHLIIIHSATRSFALMTDTACNVREYTKKLLTKSSEILPDLPFLAGVARLSDGPLLIQDPEALLSTDETEAIDELIRQKQL